MSDRRSSASADRDRLDRELGTGGMATAFLAHDLRYDRPIAIKVVHPDIKPENILLQEAALSSPNSASRWP